MDIVALRRKLTADSIAFNPVSITLTRMTKTSDGAGGWIETPTALPVQSLRIFLSNQSATKDLASEGGQVQVKQHGMLCAWDADVAKGDEFVFGGRRYRVHKTDPVRVAGEIVSWQCGLEVI